ncbi:hypothetical protein CDLVIII_0524 [Clostridium sp. DL-VIII]|uniref:hypothetical protein n=1 Tax=Clostridium sp. DL-VIII TaxID=641107 RepID=UPI00023AF4D7|nr:hypothetical protein [Clostridium sp. DL-VIII]EHI97259.1 hypothetical protein CDLVIII_0524 [Clostridium sp. DL-VIII]
MIVQTFKFDNTMILELYHDCFNDYPKDREIVDTKSIKEGKLIFEEKCICNVTFPQLPKYEWILDSDHFMNPYYDYSSTLIEYRNTKKLESIFNDFKYELFVEIDEFIKKHANIDISKYPYVLGNSLFYTPQKYKVIIEKSKDNYKNRMIKIDGVKNSSDIIIFEFKIDERTINTFVVQGNNILQTDFEWKSFDVTVINDSKIVFKSLNNSNLRKCGTAWGGSFITKEISLKTVNKNIKLTKWISSDRSRVLEKDDSELYYKNNLRLKYDIKRKSYSNTYFLASNETDKLFDILEKYSKKECDELWIVDSCFLNIELSNEENIKTFEKICDIVIMFSQNTNIKKRVIFRKGKDETINNFLDELKNNRLCKYTDIFQNYNFELIRTSTNVHDRFIFLVHANHITGILFGGSFNKLGENYSTIVELDPISAKEIFLILQSEVKLNGQSIKL